VVHIKRLYSLCHFTKVGLSVFLLFPAVFIQLLVKNSSDECFAVSLGNIFLCSTCTMRKFLVASTLLQFKPVCSYPIPYGFGEQIILQQTYLCLRTATVSFPVLFFLHKL